MFRFMFVSMALFTATAANAQALQDRSSLADVAVTSETASARIPRSTYTMSYVPLDYAYAINTGGAIAGSVGGRAAIFSGGKVTYLQTSPYYTDVRADDISNSGRIIGSGMSAGARRMLYWENAQSMGYDTGSIARYLFPQSINSQGVVVGYYYTNSMDDSPQGFRWSPSSGITTITPWGATYAQPFDISDTGYVAGMAWYSGIGQQAVRWYPNGEAGRITGPAFGDRAFDDGSVLGMANGSTLWNLSNTATLVGPAPATHHVQQRNSSNRWVGYTLPGSLPWTSVGTGAAEPLPIPSGAFGYAHDVNACGTILGSVRLADGTSRPVYWSRKICDNT